MGTTVTAIFADCNGEYVIGHIGDTRAYITNGEKSIISTFILQEDDSISLRLKKQMPLFQKLLKGKLYKGKHKNASPL